MELAHVGAKTLYVKSCGSQVKSLVTEEGKHCTHF